MSPSFYLTIRACLVILFGHRATAGYSTIGLINLGSFAFGARSELGCAIFVSPKTDFRSDRDQLEDRPILKYEFKKPPKGYNNPLRGFT